MRRIRKANGIGSSAIPRRAWGALLVFLVSAIPAGRAYAAQQQEEKVGPVIDYRIGAKDVLQVTVFEKPELNQTVRVSEDGSVSLLLLGKVRVAGLTAQEVEKNLAQILLEKYLNTAHVTVFIKEYQRVSVIGAVAKPGSYEIVGPTTLLQIIAEAGGLTPEAANELYVIRQGADGQKDRIPINLNDLMNRGDQTLNIDLQAKDVVNIPKDQTFTVFVNGEVKTPGAIQFKQSRKLTLLQAIGQAGGVTEWASKSKVVINRKDAKTGKEMRIPINLNKIYDGVISDIFLEDGDVIVIR